MEFPSFRSAQLVGTGTISEASSNSQRFVISEKRDSTWNEPVDWHQLIKHIPGVTVTADGNRMRIDATPAAIATIKQKYGEWLNVEPLTYRQTQS